METGTSRLYDIARMFSESGWETEVITTDFEHFEKRQRDLERIRAEQYPFHVTFLSSLPYKKNIGPGRILSNLGTAVSLSEYLRKRGKKYDAVYCTIPSNRVAAVAAAFCRKEQIPLIVDVEDLWPEAMYAVIRQRNLRKLLLAGLRRDADFVYDCADGVIGTSEEYTERAFLRRPKNIPSKTVYVGCDLAAFDRGVRTCSPLMEKPEDEIWITYSGSLGESYGLQYLIAAAKKLQLIPDPRIRLKILGTGVAEDRLKKYAERLRCMNVDFLGFLPYQKMAAYLSESDIVVNSFRKGVSQSFVNKIGDYLASGKPMINTLENRAFRNFVKENHVGLNVRAENPEAIAEAVLYLLNHPAVYRKMAINARQAAEEKFDRKKTYPEIVKMTSEIVRTRGEKCRFTT